MYEGVEVNSNINLDYLVAAITIMLRLSLAESAGHFSSPAEFKNVVNTDFENLKHL